MICDDAGWLTKRESLQINVLGITLTTRIPDFDGWSTAVILHPFEDEMCRPLRWQEIDKRRDVSAIEQSAGHGRFSPTSGELDSAQAKILLQILCPARTSVCLGFGANILVAPPSLHTRAQRNANGRIDPHSPQLVSAGSEQVLMSRFVGTGVELIESLSGPHGWLEWPTVMWAEDRSWMLDSHWDAPFTVIAADEKTADRISSCPDLDTLTPRRSTV